MRSCIAIVFALFFVAFAEHGENVGSFCVMSLTAQSPQNYTCENENKTYTFRPFEVLPTNSYLTYYDNPMSTSYSFVHNGTSYNFVFAQQNGQVWASNISSTNTGLTIQVTDFVGTEVDWTTELNRKDGVFFCRTKERYTTKNTSSTYTVGPTINNVIAINLDRLLKDILDGLPGSPSSSISSPNRLTSISGLSPRDYYVSIKRYTRQSGAKFRVSSKDSECGWGMVYDTLNEYLYVATTSLTSIPTNGGNTQPSMNYIERIEIPVSINFSSNSLDFTSNTAVSVSTDEVRIGHLMINPWDPTKLAIDNYASQNSGNVPSDPSKLVIFTIPTDLNNVVIKHYRFPDYLSTINGFTHASFCGPEHMIIAHMNWDQGYVLNYSTSSRLSTQNSSFDGEYHLLRDHYRLDTLSARKGMKHAAMSTNGKFIVSDLGRATPIYDQLYLWYSIDGKTNCVGVVNGINTGDVKPHPHASFINNDAGENRIIIFNNDTEDAIWGVEIPDQIWNRRDEFDDFREIVDRNFDLEQYLPAFK